MPYIRAESVYATLVNAASKAVVSDLPESLASKFDVKYLTEGIKFLSKVILFQIE